MEISFFCLEFREFNFTCGIAYLDLEEVDFHVTRESNERLSNTRIWK